MFRDVIDVLNNLLSLTIPLIFLLLLVVSCISLHVRSLAQSIIKLKGQGN